MILTLNSAVGDATLYLSVSPHAIDIALVTKRTAVFRCAQLVGIDLHQIGAIGDGVNDLPFLTIPGLGLIGAPANAELRVRSELGRIPGAMLLNGPVTDGFLAFYEMCAERDLLLVISDRDGVLIDGGADSTDRFRLVVDRVMRGPGPALWILTGSSAEQNLSLLDGVASSVDRVTVMAENGSIVIDPLTRQTHLTLPHGLESVLPILKGPFESEFRRLLATTILPCYGLVPVEASSASMDDLSIPDKMTMITIDLPRRFRDHASPVASDFRREVLRLAECLGRAVGFNVEHI